MSPQPLDPVERPRLVCLHAAGATSAMFAELGRHLGDHTIFETIELPGRGSVYHQAPLRQLDAAVGYVLSQLTDLPDRGYAILGYSMGALVGFEMVRRQLEIDGPLPAVFFVAAACAPQIPARERPLHMMDDDSLISELPRFQSNVPHLLANRELMALVMPRLRADFELCETYNFCEGRELPIPIYAFGGSDDDGISEDDLAAWSDLTSAGGFYEMLPGGHFFIEKQSERLADRIAVILRSTLHQSDT